MARKRDGLVPIEEAISHLDGPVKKLRDATPQAVHHFTRFDQVNQLVEASEADPDMGFMARLLALCCLPRTNPGDRWKYVRRNGPYELIMISGGKTKLPYGNPAAPAVGLGLDRGRQNPVSHVDFRELIGRVHAQAGHSRRQR